MKPGKLEKKVARGDSSAVLGGLFRSTGCAVEANGWEKHAGVCGGMFDDADSGVLGGCREAEFVGRGGTCCQDGAQAFLQKGGHCAGG